MYKYPSKPELHNKGARLVPLAGVDELLCDYAAAAAQLYQCVPPGGAARGAVWTDEDKKLSDMMTSYWANFIATGDPNGKGLPKWDAYNMKTNDGKAMVLGDTVEFGPQIDVPRLAFFDKFYAVESK